MFRRVCVFCGSHSGNSKTYQEAAQLVGRTLAEQGIGVVYGGGNAGLMGEVARAAISYGGKVIGVIPESLRERELLAEDLSETYIVASMHERKALMAEKSDAFIALPGGFGTFDELCEMLTWAQLGFHHKPIGIYNVNGYFDPFVLMMDKAVEEGFLRPHNRRLARVESDFKILLGRMLAE